MYFSDGHHNDAKILIDMFERDELGGASQDPENKPGQGITKFVKSGDLFILDRGFRDAIDFLNKRGINTKMPKLLQQSIGKKSGPSKRGKCVASKCDRGSSSTKTTVFTGMGESEVAGNITKHID